jgi:hypothetical protein
MTNSGYDQILKFYAGENSLKKYDNALRILFPADEETKKMFPLEI